MPGRASRTRRAATGILTLLFCLTSLGGMAAEAARRPRARSRVIQRGPLPADDLRLPPSRPWTSPNAPEVQASAAILLEADSGRILFGQNEHARRAPASTTKIMTGLLILERGRLRESVVVSASAARTGGHSLGLRRGQRITLGDLLSAALIMSANDAAVAAAEHLAGSEGAFVALMNARARELGMRDTHFANPHGLDAPDHYSSAYDLALLTRFALQDPRFAQLVQERAAAISLGGANGRRVRRRLVRTHNRLLGTFEGADGVKTGYTDQAGRCLVASAVRQEQRLIAVLLNDSHRWVDAAQLLEFGFGTLRAEEPPLGRAAGLLRGQEG